MKKWFEYQLDHQVRDRDWTSSYAPLVNINHITAPYVDQIKNLYHQCKERQDPALHDDGNLVGSAHYADYIAETYQDPYVKQNIHAWCRDPEFLALTDHHSLYKMFYWEIQPDLCRAMIAALGFQENSSRVALHIQPPGSFSPLHIDSVKNLETNGDKKFLTGQDADYDRYMVFLEDWQWGQVYQFGDQFVKWRAGDVFYWRLNDVPHAAANLGYHTRFSFLLRGRPRDC
jgi:hypothetical protein